MFEVAMMKLAAYIQVCCWQGPNLHFHSSWSSEEKCRAHPWTWSPLECKRFGCGLVDSGTVRAYLMALRVPLELLLLVSLRCLQCGLQRFLEWFCEPFFGR